VSSTLDRLRRLHGLRPSQKSEPDLPHAAPVALRPVAGRVRRLETLVPGEEVETEHGPCYVVTAHYALHTVRGRRSLLDLLGRTPRSLASLYPNAGLDGDFDFRRVAFIDTETTGLGGGAGVYAFMVGVGTFEEIAGSRPGTTSFVVRQFFMRHPGEELALLTALADLLNERSGLVTFNGRTFDAPLLRGRYRLNRPYLNVDAPEPIWNDSAPHLDLLHPARRLWKGRLSSCALSSLERTILAHERGEDDVPGSLIPALYQQYLQNADAHSMRQVFYHNLEDILSMTFLAECICRHFDDPLDDPVYEERHGADLLALGQIHEQMGHGEQAERALRLAVVLLDDSVEMRAEAFATLGRLLKRQDRWSEAAELWQEWITTIPGPDPRPYEELAKYCEWQLGDLDQAIMWTGWALHNQQAAPAWQRSRQTIDALTHRLNRLRSKESGQADHVTET
jgi:uncharacterized protein YprB with RNaseH-like and TPR domain